MFKPRALWLLACLWVFLLPGCSMFGPPFGSAHREIQVLSLDKMDRLLDFIGTSVIELTVKEGRKVRQVTVYVGMEGISARWGGSDTPSGRGTPIQVSSPQALRFAKALEEASANWSGDAKHNATLLAEHLSGKRLMRDCRWKWMWD